MTEQETPGPGIPLPPEPTPGPHLEDAVVARLREHDLLDDRAPQRERRRPLLAWGALLGWAASLLVAFVAGRSVASTADPTHMLLLENTDAMDESAAAESVRVQEYGRWARAEGAAGRVTDGAPLAEAGVRLSWRGDAVQRRALPPGEEPRLSGWFLIRAQTDGEAADIAAGCPHLRHGGRVHVRRLGER